LLGGQLGVSAVGESPHLDSVIDGVLPLKRDDGYLGIPGVATFQAGPEFAGLSDFGERAGLKRIIQIRADIPDLGGAAVDHFNAHRDGPLSDHSQSIGCSIGEINDPSFGEGTTVIDSDLNGPSILEVGDYDSTPEGKRLMRCGHVVLVVDRPTGRA